MGEGTVASWGCVRHDLMQLFVALAMIWLIVEKRLGLCGIVRAKLASCCFVPVSPSSVLSSRRYPPCVPRREFDLSNVAMEG